MRTRGGVCYPKVKNNHMSVLKPTVKNGFRLQPEKIEIRRVDLGSGGSRKRVRDLVVGAPPTEMVTDCPKRSKVMPDSGTGSGGAGGVRGGGGRDFFDGLPDDLVISVLRKFSASATCPADFITILFTTGFSLWPIEIGNYGTELRKSNSVLVFAHRCKRLNGLALHSLVLSKASPRTFAIRAKNWSESAHRFLKFCADAGNSDASYTLGMIRFYCLHNRGSGASLMAKAAINSHAQALYSLSVIQFNGSGGSKNDKDLRAGVALCARAAFLGHVDALRELGHCLQDGYGVRQNITEGRRFLVQANARELAAVIASNPSALSSSAAKSWLAHNYHQLMNQNDGQNNRLAAAASGCPLLSDFGCNVPPPEVHPANRFLVEWFRGKKLDDGLRLCSHKGCGRPETRPHEFRRCSVCATVNYCSRACQALDWKLSHKGGCAPMERWMMDLDGGEEGGLDDGDEEEEGEDEDEEMEDEEEKDEV